MIMKKLCSSILLIIISLSLTGCAGLFYYPQKKVVFYAPQKTGFQPEDIWLKVKNEFKVHGWWIPSKQSESLGTLIFFHGNGENLTSHYMHIAWLTEFGYNVFIFDYPGYGLSSHSPSPEKNVLVGEAVLEWISQNRDSRPLIVYGQSIGGITALRAVEEAQDRVPIKALIADSTLSSFKAIAKEKLRMHWLTFPLSYLVPLLLSDEWAPHLDQIKPSVPVLVIHGDKDQIVPLHFGLKIFDELKNPNTLWVIPNGQHTDVFWSHDKKYRSLFVKWLAEH